MSLDRYGLEIEPRYVDASIRRMAEHAGLEAVLGATGQSFDEVAQQRLNEDRSGSPSDSEATDPSED